MPAKPRPAELERARAILDRLEQAMPEAKIELSYATDLELLVAVMLSAQCTDKRVNSVTPALFARCRTAADYARMRPRELEGFIHTCGLFRSKARNIIASCQVIEERGGQVPRTREDLAELPGVGPKTAGVVSMHLGGGEALPVDTHVKRLAYRLGLSRETDPNKVEADLGRLIPPARWGQAHHLLIWHGRRTCFARNPACDRCPVETLCPKRGMARGAARSAAARGRDRP